MRNEADLHPHVPEEKAQLFTALDGGSTENEYLELLTALVRVQKPERVLETGCYLGVGTAAIAKGLRANGFGKLHSVDFNKEWLNRTSERLVQENLTQWVDLHEGDSIKFIKSHDPIWDSYDMTFFDSDLPMRMDEFIACLDHGILKPGALATFHDTSILREFPLGTKDLGTQKIWEQFEELVKSGRVKRWIDFPLSRGFLAVRVT